MAAKVLMKNFKEHFFSLNIWILEHFHVTILQWDPVNDYQSWLTHWPQRDFTWTKFTVSIFQANFEVIDHCGISCEIALGDFHWT